MVMAPPVYTWIKTYPRAHSKRVVYFKPIMPQYRIQLLNIHPKDEVEKHVPTFLDKPISWGEKRFIGLAQTPRILRLEVSSS